MRRKKAKALKRGWLVGAIKWGKSHWYTWREYKRMGGAAIGDAAPFEKARTFGTRLSNSLSRRARKQGNHKARSAALDYLIGLVMR